MLLSFFKPQIARILLLIIKEKQKPFLMLNEKKNMGSLKDYFTAYIILYKFPKPIDKIIPKHLQIIISLRKNVNLA